MNGEKITDALEFLDEALIEEAHGVKKKPRTVMLAAAMAACFALLILAAFLKGREIPQPTVTPPQTVAEPEQTAAPHINVLREENDPTVVPTPAPTPEPTPEPTPQTWLLVNETSPVSYEEATKHLMNVVTEDDLLAEGPREPEEMYYELLSLYGLRLNVPSGYCPVYTFYHYPFEVQDGVQPLNNVFELTDGVGSIVVNVSEYDYVEFFDTYPLEKCRYNGVEVCMQGQHGVYVAAFHARGCSFLVRTVGLTENEFQTLLEGLI